MRRQMTASEMGRKGGLARGENKVRGNAEHYRTLASKRHVARGEWGGYEIHAGRIGWIVEIYSRITGTLSGERVRVGYDLVPASVDLDAAINETGTTNAQLVVEYALHGQGQTLRRGRRVE